ncbi:MAG: protein phosphatase 2C domain-containing protein [Pirellulales bacterium]|nr:protein phosphatase 2C domain-containing protein [Pirellulales bacterium]
MRQSLPAGAFCDDGRGSWTFDMHQPAPEWNHGIDYATASDIGLRRTNNQDSHVVVLAGTPEIYAQRGHLFMVADGMGAHAAGELASKLATDSVPHAYLKLVDAAPPEALRGAVVEANHEIHGRGQANVEFHGMGTTATTLVLLPQGALVAHVGDSRVYRLREDRLEQLSFDHSLVWEMIASGQIPKDQVPAYVPKNIITRSLGPSAEVNVDIEGPFPIQSGDTYLLCSDGLTGQVSDEELGTLLGCLSPKEAVQALVDLANLRGGPDNITVIVVRVMSLPPTAVNGWQVAPPTSTKRAASQQVPLAVWVALPAAAVAAIVCALAQAPIPAFIALVVAVGLAILALVRRLDVPEGQSVPLPEGRYGAGPHRTQICQPNNSFVDKLHQVVQQLREAALEEKWEVDWSRFDDFQARALGAAEKKSYGEAVREFSHAISFMMSELRRQPPHQGLAS